MSSERFSIEQFDPEKSDFGSYIDRFDQFLIVNNVSDEQKKRAMLITHIGPDAYAVLENLVMPEKPVSKDFKDLVKILKEHFTPKRVVMVERFKFHKRDQKENENMAEYIVQLKKMAKFCEFGAELPSVLRDRFVCGMKNESIQKKLLTVADLTFDKACSIALSMEAAHEQASVMHQIVGKVFDKSRRYNSRRD